MENNTISQQLEALYDDYQNVIRQNGDGEYFVKDGVMFQDGIDWKVTEQQWTNSEKPRVMFALKGKSKEADADDIRFWLKDMPTDNAKVLEMKQNNRNLVSHDGSNFLKNIAFVLTGLTNEAQAPKFNEIDINDAKKIFNTHPFAMVECKKTPANIDDVKRFLEGEYGNMLRREIVEILKPNRIVCTNDDIFRFVCTLYPDAQAVPNTDARKIRYVQDSDILIFRGYDPRQVNETTHDCEVVYNSVMDNFRKFLEWKNNK